MLEDIKHIKEKSSKFEPRFSIKCRVKPKNNIENIKF